MGLDYAVGQNAADLVGHPRAANERDEELILDVDVVLGIGNEGEVRRVNGVFRGSNARRPLAGGANDLKNEKMCKNNLNID